MSKQIEPKQIEFCFATPLPSSSYSSPLLLPPTPPPYFPTPPPTSSSYSSPLLLLPLLPPTAATTTFTTTATPARATATALKTQVLPYCVFFGHKTNKPQREPN